MGQTVSNTNNTSKNLDILKRQRAKKIKKLLLKRNALQNKLNNSTDMNETLDWLTDSTLNLSSDTQNGGSATSDNKNLDKINSFFKNQNNTDTTQNFSKYQNELSNLEKYIQQLGGFDALEGRILNISHSDFLKKMELHGGSILDDISENSDDLDEINKELQLETESNKTNKTNSDIEKLDNYVRQMGGYDIMNNRLLNITNNNLPKLDSFDSNSDVTISTIGFTDTNLSGGSIFQHKNFNKSLNSNNSLTSSINNLQLGGNLTLSQTSLSQNGGNLNLSQTSLSHNNTIQNGGNLNLSQTSNTNKLSELSQNANSENILNGGAKKKKKSIKLKRTIRNLSTSDSNTNELSTTDSSSSSQSNVVSLSNTSSSDIPEKKDSDTVSTDDTARFAKVISKKINLSESDKVESSIKRSSSSSSSSSSENKKNENIDSDLDDGSSSSSSIEEDDDNNSEEQIGGSELKAVPFYSSENSTDFYRSYQQKNRFN